MRLFQWKEKVDERERMEMYRNEHYIFWFFFWALALKVLVYKLILMAPAREYIFELAILLIAAVWMGIMDFRDGHYDYHTTPGWKSYLLYAGGFSVFFTVFMVAGGVHQGWLGSAGEILMVGAIEFVVFFVILYGLMAMVGAITKWRRKKLEEQLLSDEKD